MQTKTEGVITIYNEQGELTAIVLKDEKSRKNVFYTVTEMGFEDIRSLLSADVKSYENVVVDLNGKPVGRQ